MKQETYELLRAKCYEIIYDGEIPLEFGCEIKFYESGIFMHRASKFYGRLVGERNGKNGRNIFIFSNIGFQEYMSGWRSDKKPKEWEMWIDDNGNLDGLSIYSEYGKSSVKILGKPLELRDLLRALQEKYTNDFHVDIIDDYVRIIYMEHYNYMKRENKIHEIKLDLTKPISSQSQEVGEQLLELIS